MPAITSRLVALGDRRPKPEVAGLGFGLVFTDHMAAAEWTPEAGWHDLRLQPYAPLQLDPAAVVLHYGQAAFEGLKAFRQADGRVALFRPEMNARRLNRSAQRLCLPEVSEDMFLALVRALVSLERDWVPTGDGTALYIRPTIIATEAALGVRSSRRFLFYIILSPVGPYYPRGFEPVRILVEEVYSRAAPGGTGEAKTGGNYAGSLKATVAARSAGYDQVLWLDATGHRLVEEVGAMNIFFVRPDQGGAAPTLVTPPLGGTILGGVVRDSLMALAPRLAYQVAEQPLAIDEVVRDIEAGRISEVFGCGTAAVITPVGRLGYRDRDIMVGDSSVGPVTRRLYDTLTGIQYGRLPDTLGWVHIVA